MENDDRLKKRGFEEEAPEVEIKDEDYIQLQINRLNRKQRALVKKVRRTGDMEALDKNGKQSFRLALKRLRTLVASDQPNQSGGTEQ